MRFTSSRPRGFTLLELMIVVAIIAILAAIALPSYTDYVRRGNLITATSQLSAYRAQMEQHYQDARTYASVLPTYPAPCPTTAITSSDGKWTYSCAITTTPMGYTITATGASGSLVDGFIYTINDGNVQATTSTPVAWNSATATDHWIMKKGG